MDANIFWREQICQTFKARFLPASPLVRSGKNLFTFSPIQDELAKFAEQPQGFFYKEQLCFRNVYPANLVNPLASPCQELISLFSFEPVSFAPVIAEFIRTILDPWISASDIYVIVPDIQSIATNSREISANVIEIPRERLICALPIPGQHYYLKVCVKFNNGLVTVANFVLVDYQGGNLAQLDSVFFPLRSTMINEHAKSLFETAHYHSLYLKVFRSVENHELTHFLMSQLEAIRILHQAVGNAGNKKQHYTIKKLAREIFSECAYHQISVTAILQNFPTLAEFLSPLYEDFLASLEKSIRQVKRSRRPVTADYAYQTLGIPYQLFKARIDPTLVLPKLPSNFAYHRNPSENIYVDPIARYR